MKEPTEAVPSHWLLLERSTTIWGCSGGRGTPWPTDLLSSVLHPLCIVTTLQNCCSASHWTLTVSPSLGA